MVHQPYPVSGSQFSRFLILQLSISSKLISSPRREIFLLQVSENSCTQPELQPASFLMRSARRPNASLTYSNALGAAPCARRELLKLSRSESHWRCSLFISLT